MNLNIASYFRPEYVNELRALAKKEGSKLTKYKAKNGNKVYSYFDKNERRILHRFDKDGNKLKRVEQNINENDNFAKIYDFQKGEVIYITQNKKCDTFEINRTISNFSNGREPEAIINEPLRETSAHYKKTKSNKYKLKKRTEKLNCKNYTQVTEEQFGKHGKVSKASSLTFRNPDGTITKMN